MRMFRNSAARLFHSVLTAMLCAGLAGCAQYRLGSTLPPGLTSINVPTFINGTSEPQLEFETTNATIQEFQKDGTLRVAVQGVADAILEVKLTGYRIDALRYDKKIATHPNEYRQQLVADLLLKNSRTEKILLDRKGVVGEWTFVAGSDLRNDERVALPLTSQQLARKIVEAVVEYW
jgi:hypothetical protein